MEESNEILSDTTYSDNESEDNNFSDNELIEEDPCPCLFVDVVAPSFREALQIDKETVGFDFYEIKNRLKLKFYDCVILINFIREMVEKKQSLLHEEKTFEDREQLVEYLKTSSEFAELSKDLPFWNDTKYLIPTLEDDPLLYSFTEELEDDEELYNDSNLGPKKEDVIEEENAENQKVIDKLKNTEQELIRCGIHLDAIRSDE